MDRGLLPADLRGRVAELRLTHRLLVGKPGKPSLRPALDRIDASPHDERVEGPSRAFGRTFRICRLLE